jgi:hypothetical protein
MVTVRSTVTQISLEFDDIADGSDNKRMHVKRIDD